MDHRARELGAINALDRLLKQPAHQLIGRFENRPPNQYLQLSDSASVWGLGFELPNQPLDFFFLRQEDRGRDLLFFKVAMFWRVSVMTNRAYSSVNC